MSRELEQALETEQYENMEYMDTSDISWLSEEYVDYAYAENYYD